MTTLSIGARPGMNNPGDLTVLGLGDYEYEGQTGVYASPNGLFYPQFQSPQSGYNAILDWLNNNVGSNPATSITNLNELTSYYLNGNYAGVVATANNPYPQSWLNSVANASGLSPTQQITTADYPAIATGIMQAEGTYGTFGGLVNTGGNPTAYQPGTIGGAIASIPFIGPSLATGLGGLSSVVTGQPAQIGGGQSVTSAQTLQAAGIDLSGVTNALGSIGAAITGFNKDVAAATSKQTWTHIAVGALGVLLIIGALIWLAMQSRTVQQVVTTAAAAA